MSKTLFKKVLSMVVVCVTLLSTSIVSVLAADIIPYYNNVISASSDAWVSNGELYIWYDYTGNSDTTKAVITTTVERKTLLFFWSDVDEWVDTVYDTTYYNTTTIPLDKTGTYRVTVEYVFYGTGGEADTVTHEFEVEY